MLRHLCQSVESHVELLFCYIFSLFFSAVENRAAQCSTACKWIVYHNRVHNVICVFPFCVMFLFMFFCVFLFLFFCWWPELYGQWRNTCFNPKCISSHSCCCFASLCSTRDIKQRQENLTLTCTIQSQYLKQLYIAVLFPIVQSRW